MSAGSLQPPPPGCSVHFLLQILLSKIASDVYLNHIYTHLKTLGVLCRLSRPQRT